jgi:hypothetical protein
MSFGRNFRMGKEGKYNLSVRAEFQNIFNQVFLSAPSSGTVLGVNVNPATVPTTANGTLAAGGYYTGGFGYIATANGTGATPRSGQAVMRFTF